MAKITPQIRHKQLFCYPDPAPVCLVGSPTWFAWLDSATAFRYFSGQRLHCHHGSGPLFAPISLRKEPRRQGWFWYAYLRSHGLLHKRYVGKSERLTIARLEEMATILNELW
jgi:LuxR family maltose regulon positive regulatory protein